jgi:hypothetical protein
MKRTGELLFDEYPAGGRCDCCETHAGWLWRRIDELERYCWPCMDHVARSRAWARREMGARIEPLNEPVKGSEAQPSLDRRSERPHAE